MLLPAFYPVTCHTKNVGPGSVFVAISGFKEDGARFIEEAIARGACEIVIAESELARQSAQKFPFIPFRFVQNTRRELARLAQERSGNPADKLTLIGVTGTKGKTTTTFLIEHILRTAGFSTALTSSVKNMIGDREEKAELTTMGADSLAVFLRECVEANVTHVVIEVASHSLALDRTYGLQFDVACFTNLAPEHLDLHGTVEEYFEAKSLLFDQLKPGGFAVINQDNHWGKILSERLGTKRPDVHQLPVSAEHFSRTSSVRLVGNFNRYNVHMATRVAEALKIDEHDIQKAIASFPGVPGRFQLHTLKNGARACVDHAHEALSFETILSELRAQTPHLIVVFGCGGGDRRLKRAPMGSIASLYADVLIITNDNPRFDDQIEIVKDIMAGIPVEKHPFIIIEYDRATAIKRAAACARSDSFIALLGKGHETHQLVGGVASYFSDFEELKKY